ncbi:membrane protein insertase YidC [Bacillus thermotolerans]|uniref:membrane protein insertase YidC n=1 Tax=Bacillus thermotolerans TaxID=1221996 RepID=UPI00058963F7|nr:membrane protein insertase YidC [Bacillus thermotolerans]KKB40870.1 Inner membrane protein translocase component YidC, OxaA protein [Bacillus thermotolerans]
MKKSSLLLFSLFGSLLLLSGCQAAQEEGHFFHDYLVNPFVELIHTLGEAFNSYGLAIIAITLAVRLILMPLMLNTMKKQQAMREKMEIVKPEMEKIQKKLKEANTQEEQRKIQQEMMMLYQQHNINPFAMGCLPIFLQIPIWMGLFYAISISEDIQHAEFLWFQLGQPDIAMALIAGLMYYVQFKVSMIDMPEQQRQQMKIIGLLSPVMILIFSFTTPAALPLYWAVSGLFLIGQTWLSKKIYPAKKPAKDKE